MMMLLWRRRAVALIQQPVVVQGRSGLSCFLCSTTTLCSSSTATAGAPNRHHSSSSSNHHHHHHHHHPHHRRLGLATGPTTATCALKGQVLIVQRATAAGTTSSAFKNPPGVSGYCYFSSAPTPSTSGSSTTTTTDTSSWAPASNSLSSSLSRTVYVENLAPHVTWQHLKDWVRSVSGHEVRSVQVYNYDSPPSDDRGTASSTPTTTTTTTMTTTRRRLGLAVLDTAEHAHEAVQALLRSGGESVGSTTHEYLMVGAVNEDTVRLATKADLAQRSHSKGSQAASSRNSTDLGTSHSQTNWNESCSIYVANLAQGVRWQDLKDFVRRVEGVRLKSVNVYCNDDDNGTSGSSPYGVAVFGHPSDAVRVRRELDGSVLAGRPVRLYTAQEFVEQQLQPTTTPAASTPPSLDFLSFDYMVEPSVKTQRPQQPQPTKPFSHRQSSPSTSDLARTVYMNNLPPNVTWKVLKDWFREQVGNSISFVDIQEGGRAIAILRSPKDADYVVSRWKNGVPVQGSNNNTTVVELSQGTTTTTTTTESSSLSPSLSEEREDHHPEQQQDNGMVEEKIDGVVYL